MRPSTHSIGLTTLNDTGCVIERPRVRAEEVLPGDRLLWADLPETSAVPAMAVIDSVEVEGDAVVLLVDGREIRLAAEAEVVVERVTT